MKFDNILIATDLDGTFFNTNADLIKRNLDAVEYFKANGGMFAIASGREPLTLGNIKSIAEDLVNIPCILCNGAYLYDFETKKRIGQLDCDVDKAAELIEFVIKNFPDIGIRLSTDKGFYSPQYNDFVIGTIGEKAELLISQGAFFISEVKDIPRLGWTRCAFSANPELLNDLREAVEEKYCEYFAFSQASKFIYEFQNVSATKGLSLKRLRDYLIGIGRADNSLRAYAVGDYENDYNMLIHADVACCPENAIDSIKEISKVRLCHCNEGTTADLIDKIEKGLA